MLFSRSAPQSHWPKLVEQGAHVVKLHMLVLRHGWSTRWQHFSHWPSHCRPKHQVQQHAAASAQRQTGYQKQKRGKAELANMASTRHPMGLKPCLLASAAMGAGFKCSIVVLNQAVSASALMADGINTSLWPAGAETKRGCTAGQLHLLQRSTHRRA